MGMMRQGGSEGGREGMGLNSWDNILNGSEHGLHTTRATYGNVAISHKTSIHCSLAPSLPACLPACLPADQPSTIELRCGNLKRWEVEEG